MEAPAIVGAGSHLGPENAMGHYLLGVASGVTEQHAAKLRGGAKRHNCVPIFPKARRRPAPVLRNTPTGERVLQPNYVYTGEFLSAFQENLCFNREEA